MGEIRMSGFNQRLAKLMAAAGVASRRAAEKMIEDGLVSVNGQIVTRPGTVVDPSRDAILVKGKPLEIEPLVYYALHKPAGYISTASDERSRKKVVDLVPHRPRVYPVGRLDRDTSGLMLLTNDGRLAYALTHPRYEVPRVYLATVRGDIDASVRSQLEQGLMLDDGLAWADKAWVLERGDVSKIRLQIHLGRNRIVRRMLSHLGRPVIELHRESIGPLRLGDLRPGSFRRLAQAEVSALYNSAGISTRGIKTSKP